MVIRIEYQIHVLYSVTNGKNWKHEKTFYSQADAEDYVNTEKYRMKLSGLEYCSKILRVSQLMVYQTGNWHTRKKRQINIGWKDLDLDHNKGISHKDGVCAWCDHVRQLGKDGYYDFMKEQSVDSRGSK